mmetsp:Transcript_3243/g.12863  ORF Transcript_3243/g.12863 Transcript_3243/m.12863 type:complete len:214 (+) Transcript_3243:390-1031(+)
MSDPRSSSSKFSPSWSSPLTTYSSAGLAYAMDPSPHATRMDPFATPTTSPTHVRVLGSTEGTTRTLPVAVLRSTENPVWGESCTVRHSPSSESGSEFDSGSDSEPSDDWIESSASEGIESSASDSPPVSYSLSSSAASSSAASVVSSAVSSAVSSTPAGAAAYARDDRSLREFSAVSSGNFTTMSPSLNENSACSRRSYTDTSSTRGAFWSRT